MSGVENAKRVLAKPRYDYLGGFTCADFQRWSVPWPPPADWRRQLFERVCDDNRERRALRAKKAA